ncbi:hypothetical protein BGZ57DRAFT_859474 [Hyaloscypha finlandica]|nr:hypothetical protein BGZ57DRAFT_859474 [Hyaloscypha finlandica]
MANNQRRVVEQGELDSQAAHGHLTPTSNDVGQSTSAVGHFLPIITLNQPLTLSNLPADIHFAIFKNLHIVHATCLGLTNTTFYAVLKAIYPGKISIDPYAYKYNWAEVGLLGNLISQWMRPRLLWDGFVFVTPERYKELEDRDYDLSLQAQFEEMCKW